MSHLSCFYDKRSPEEVYLLSSLWAVQRSKCPPEKQSFTLFVFFFLFCVVFNSLNTCFHCRVSTSMGNRAGFHTGYRLKRMINRSVCPAGLLIRSMEKSTKWPIRTLHMKVYGIGRQAQEKKKKISELFLQSFSLLRPENNHWRQRLQKTSFKTQMPALLPTSKLGSQK